MRQLKANVRVGIASSDAVYFFQSFIYYTSMYIQDSPAAPNGLQLSTGQRDGWQRAPPSLLFF